ncbi:hypothetical protein N431DRAFT_492275 [Stipitochalara longipes BDJ]|nr:hypothetical protein N431DRAFT_492275 [Stipitochalara longipes BDJ]
MDKIKNILSSNTAKNDEVPHGSGRELGTTNNSGAFSGEGTHLAEAHNTPAGTTPGIGSNQTSGIGNSSEGSHLARAHDTNAGTTSGPAGNQISGATNTSSNAGPDHLARDAAVAASGVGVAEHEHRKHENERELGSSTTGQGVSNTQRAGYTQGVGSTQGMGYQSSPANDLPSATSMAAGSTGINQDTSYHTGPTGTAVQGPHSTDTANRLDPAIKTSGTTRLEDAHEHLERHGGGAEAADKHHSDKVTGSGQTPDKHHLGRDAAIGGGIGAAAYEADKHHNQSQAEDRDTFAGQSHPTTTTSTTTTTTPSGLQSSGTAYQTDPAVGNSSKDHHYGRDAAVGAGVGAGAAGLAEHEHHKRASEYHPRDNVPVHDSKTSSTAQGSTKDASLLPGPAPNTAGPHKKDWMNKLDPFVDSHPTSKTTDADILALPVRQGQGSFSEQTIDQDGKHLPRSDVGEGFASDSHSSGLGHSGVGSGVSGDQKDHHYGRDAAAAGAVGGAAYEADKHHREHESNTLAHPSHSAATGQSTTTTTTNPQSSVVDSNTSKDHHYGRDAAVAGGVGGAAYEAEKHHKHDKDLTQAERDAKKEQKHEAKEAKKEHKHEAREEKKEHKDSKGGLLGFLHRDKNKTYTPEEEAEFDRQDHEHHASHKERDTAAAAGAGAGAGALYASDKHQYAGQTTSGTTGTTTGTGTQDTMHHHGRDATLGAGAVGAAGVAEHEHNRHSGATPLAEKPKGKDIGDILHGVERNRGVPGSSGFPGTEGFGTGTGGALAAQETAQSSRSEATTDQSGAALPLDPNPELGANLTGQHQKIDSRYGAGGDSYQTGQYDNTTSGSGLTGSRHADPSSAVPQTTGLATDNEYRKQDTTSGLMGSNTQSGFTGSDSAVTGLNEGTDGRNRLHKDPPAGHPAAQTGSSHVPANKNERENLLNEGETVTDKDSGAANSHADREVNAATNY